MFETSTLDDEDFLKLFVEEIWEMILDEMMLLSVDDVVRWYWSSPFFRRLLQRKRVSLLLPQVLDILYKNGYVIPKTAQWILMGEDEPFAIKAEETVPPSFYSRLGNGGPTDTRPPTILNLRLVCKMWKTAVDNFYRERLYHGKSKDIAFGKAFEQIFMSTHFLPSYPRTSIPSFLEYFNESRENYWGNLEQNPFLIKSCTFRFSKYNTTAEQEFKTEVTSLLQIYGRHLDKCTFDFRMVDDSRLYFDNMLEWLELVPNLKQLEIVNWLHPPSERFDQKSMVEALLRNPISRMESLEDLVLERVDPPISTGIVRANNHVTRLYITYSLNRRERHILEQLPNLTHLKATIFTDSQVDIFKSSKFKCSLKTLELQLYFVEYPPMHIFKVAQNMFGKSLQNFSLLFVRNASTTSSDLKSEILRDCKALHKTYLPNVDTFHVDVKESHWYMFATIKCFAYWIEGKKRRRRKKAREEEINSRIKLCLSIGVFICLLLLSAIHFTPLLKIALTQVNAIR